MTLMVRVIKNFGDDDDLVKLRTGEIYEFMGVERPPGGKRSSGWSVVIDYQGKRLPFPESHFSEPQDGSLLKNPVFGIY